MSVSGQTRPCFEIKNLDSRITKWDSMEDEKQVPTDVAYWHDIYRVTDDLLRPGISVDESQRMYDQWAKMGTYDALAVESKYYTAHDQIILGILSMYPVRRDIRILDVGAGTGLVGERLRNLGFERVDALDPSAEMLRSAAKKGVYERLIHSFFTNDPIKDVDEDTYDAIVMCGVCGPGAVPVEAFEEAVRIVKPGGHIFVCMRAENLEICSEYNGRWQPFVTRLQQEGKWRLVSECKYPQHYFHFDGLRLIYQVTKNERNI
ncbi:uncharacterized protein LOC112565068 [Pomacea canaliculata]|uniref:uncharacterized protein LOC112565068 n=1 Tax=Pomacea canaliculata TaxID=400727 RepID=UPI000D72C8A3|nr:uncharacterized protein LOC112565068 [Pomacea canaliculata]